MTAIDPELARYAPLVDVILPIPISDNDLTSAMSGEIRSGNVRELLARLLAHEANQAPLLIVMEDLHWFDLASWALLVDVQQSAAAVPGAEYASTGRPDALPSSNKFSIPPGHAW